MAVNEVAGPSWRVQYGEIAEQLQFRIGRVGQEVFDAYFPIASLADVTAVLSASTGLSVGAFSRGTNYQTQKLPTWQNDIALTPLSYTPVPPLLQLYLAEVPELVGLLQALAPNVPSADPGDWDDSRPKPIPFAQMPMADLEDTFRTQYAAYRAAGPVAPATARPEASTYPRLVNPVDFPLLRWSDVDPVSALNGLYWPHLVDMARAGLSGVSLLFSSDHASTHGTSGIGLAVGGDLLQPGGLTPHGDVWRDDGGGTQCETPSTIDFFPGTNDWLISYQLAGVAGASTDQSSMVARAGADFKSGWSRVGIMNNPQKRDMGRGSASHTGYASNWKHNGQYFSSTLLNGNTSGTFMTAQSLITSFDGINWRQDPRPLWGNPSLIEHLHGYDSVTKWAMNLWRSTPFRWQGEWWAIGTAGPSASGSEAQSFRLVATRLSNDFRRPTNLPIDVTPAAQSWETGPVDQIGAVFSWRGRLFLPYRVGGKTGAFGVKEIV